MFKKPILIFDFDGTLADTHQYIVEIFNSFSSYYNYHTIPWDKIENFKDKTPREIIQMLKIPPLKIPRLLSKAKKKYHLGLCGLKPFEGLKETLYALKEAGIKMGILSSNSKENIVPFLENHGLDIFDFIHTTTSVLSKNAALKKIIAQKKISFDQVLYIGDEIRDIIAAKKLGIKVAAVSWGYNSAHTLSSYQPDFLFEQPSDIAAVIE
ncbi:MAG: HAD-IA family hydrolase [Candidatus Omnitrophica bacterium]|nr:HAD-IA family hydrolase [Candidatus Omnitrophota bacterium]